MHQGDIYKHFSTQDIMKLVQNIDNLSLPGTVKVIKAGL
jgi:hypothetical protein